jgi:hypothetical protein
VKPYLIALATLMLGACNEPTVPTSDQKMNAQQEALANEAVMQVGMPAITNFQEKRMAKSVWEARDKTIATTTYVMAENSGQIFKLCDSVGYGLPYSTQFTNPSKVVERSCPGSGCSLASIPQADPNGLFSPSATDATWVFCLDPSTKKDKPVYVEPKVIVSPFALELTPVAFGKTP